MPNLSEHKIGQEKLHANALSLESSAIVTLFEIDISDMLFEMGLISELNEINKNSRVFLFHGEQKLGAKQIIWQGRKYNAAPIRATGFSTISSGTLPKPKLEFISNDPDSPFFTAFRSQMNSIGDLVGAKVTRIRTLAKFLDSENFTNDDSVPKPKGFSADPNAEFPRDIFFVERKLIENKTVMSFELVSILDLEKINLPFRTMYANRCPWTYRGAGCCYEFSSRRTSEHDGCNYMPNNAKPIAKVNDEKFTDLPELNGIALSDAGLYNASTQYSPGMYVYTEKDNVKYYFVCILSSLGNSPTNSTYWEPDKCSKSIKGCRLRWEEYVQTSILPFGGFPALGRIR